MKNKTLILIRGASGSGKSTMSQLIWHGLSYGNVSHREADSYFTTIDGEYIFDPAKLKEAHKWCQESTWEDLRTGLPFVVVSNTFTQAWELQPYIDMANAYGYSVFVIRCENDFGNVHGLPEEAVERQRNRMESLASKCVFDKNGRPLSSLNKAT